ncbi:MAG: F0F1 ATP synthase subunit epsilon [Actinomycetota bacterium]|nr:F0F1 ATP synthase subunit epsilon [Actinomycetota bacterium]
MSQLQVDLVAADRKVWSGEARMVRARTSDGELGIMPQHQPLLGVLVSGEVVIHGEDGDQVVTVDSGFLSVEHDRVTIVVDSVEAPEARA